MNIKVSANSLPQLFEKIGHELLKTFINPGEVGEVIREKIVVEGVDTSSLLKEWINALLRMASDQKMLFKGYRFQVFEAERLGPGKLRAEITGELIDPLRHVFLKEPMGWYIKDLNLINDSKSIEAQFILENDKISQK